MTVKGPLPKLHPIRDIDGVKRRAEFTRLVADDQVRGPDLPTDIAWPEPTVALYESLRRDPVAQALTDTDWHHVIDTMNLHRLMWANEPSNSIKVAAEVRLRLAQLGITPEARLRLRLLIADSASTDADRTGSAHRGMTAERKRRLLAAVNDNPQPVMKGTT